MARSIGMGHERDDNQSGGTDKRQQPTDQQNQPRPTDEQGQPDTTSDSGEPRPSDQSETLTTDQGPGAGTTSSGGSAGGFVGSKGPDSDEHVEERASNDSGEATANPAQGNANESDSGGDGERNPT
jgi:hypothetical protein